MKPPRRILLVEDDPSNRTTLSILLEDEGFVVDTAESLEHALTLVRKVREGNAYDVVLLDRKLPDGDGLDYVERLRDAGAERTPSKIVVLSGSAVEDVRLAKADAAIVKGESFPALLALIDGLLRG